MRVSVSVFMSERQPTMANILCQNIVLGLSAQQFSFYAYIHIFSTRIHGFFEGNVCSGYGIFGFLFSLGEEMGLEWLMTDGSGWFN
jgi:hypothetical protein